MANRIWGILSSLMLQKAIGKTPSDIRRSARRCLWQAALAVLAILFAISALLLAVAALFIYMAHHMPALHAMLWICAGVTLTAVILAGLAWALPRSGPRSGSEHKPGQTNNPAEADPTALLMKEVTKLITESPAKASIAALVAGLTVGYFPEVRALILKALNADGKKPDS